MSNPLNKAANLGGNGTCVFYKSSFGEEGNWQACRCRMPPPAPLLLSPQPLLIEVSVLETVCPVEWRAARRRLCCVLVCGGGAAAGEKARAQLRELARAPAAPPDRLHYAYLYAHKQPHFLHAIANGSGEDTSKLEHRIVIIWRREPSRVQYEWLNETWPTCVHERCGEGPPTEPEALAYRRKLNETKHALDHLIRRLLRPTELLAYEAQVQELVDESGAWASAAWRALLELLEWAERGAGALRGPRALQLLSAALTVAALVGGGYLMAYLVYDTPYNSKIRK
ncbi:hypothetical protein EVAR_82247_1 [Eumeta japonica]|uniref:Uncharacterized protein n=1 Tax=Eumeta variegata TaxID=151549 RepID=A0A4C1W183_EUMVA|nr:hypothetical protein EVAR_82247_1 [Eumeta japonica]